MNFVSGLSLSKKMGLQNGRDQLFHLGRRLSQHYRNLMEPRNDNVSKDFQVVTTSVHRCYESAQNLLAGFFSLSPGWTRLEAVEKQPVPILYQSPDKTTVRILLIFNAPL